MKIWTCGRSPRSGSRNAWTWIKNVNGASRLSKSGIFSALSKLFPVWRDWWPWTKPDYILMTPRQSNNQWSGGIAAHPTRPQKIPSAKIRWKISRLDFSGSRRHPPHWLSSKGPNYQRGVLLISVGAYEGHFEGKRREKGNKGVLFLHNNASAHRSLATQKKLAYLCFQCLDHPPYSPDLAPSTTTCFLDWKKIENSPFFSDAEVIAAAETWLDGQPSDFFLSGLQKLEQQAKKCIDLRGEYVE